MDIGYGGEPLLIPINMRDGSLLCVGKGNEDTIPRWTETEGYPVDGSLHRCIQYTNIGLECNIINRPDNVLNFIGTLFELFPRTGLFGRSPNQRCAPLKT